ncbi:hypothetical protein Patl1_34246 [Pistacia atlantica]|uniref:Uncharacterized protein n=1 Tax=Pistacia atlantica TaxID=434234 RepID=A0ACC0ZP64_9ROSI|nr:hypothetical protein Patl1_34246 [Pistacia atlantica]
MSTPLEHDYIGLSETSSMERSPEKLSSSSSSSSCSTELNNNNSKNKTCLNFKETELRLGLPGSRSPERKTPHGVSLFGKDIENNTNGFCVTPLKNIVSGAKRGFSDAIDGSSGNWEVVDLDDKSKMIKEAAGVVPLSPKPTVPEKKNQVPAANEPSSAPAANMCLESVENFSELHMWWDGHQSDHSGRTLWPLILAKNNDDAEAKSGSGCLYVKVSMDGAPYLRKVDLKINSNYVELSSALEKMFSCFTIGQCDSHGLPGRDGLSESCLMDLLHGSEYVLTYEDKDGDWMLVGDVPWDMFTDTCRRLRIMKGSEAIGLAPRAMEKCKNRS